MDPAEDQPSQFPLGDAFADVPLFREIQRVLLSSPGPINWELARQVGIAMASWGSDDPAPTDQDQRTFADMARMAELAIADFTSLPIPTDVAEVAAFRRAQWVEANVEALRPLLDPVAVKLAEAMKRMQGDAVGLPPGIEGSGDFFEMVMGRMVPLLLGAQVGSALGYLGQRVLGQYDLALPRPTGSLCFVVPNIARFEHDWSLEPREFRAWIALHEVTHRFEFARPWVREHFVA